MVVLNLSTGAVAALVVALGNKFVDAAIPNITGFQLTWGDDFTGAQNSPPSTTNWIVDTGTSYPGGPANWGTNEIQTYTNSATNLRQNGAGNLEIVAVKTSNDWTSARIETQRKDFAARSGGIMKIQASLRLPSVSQPAGYWAAFWTLGADYRGNYTNWPGVGEWDIMENVNGLNKVWGTLHCDKSPGGTCNETNGMSGNRACDGTTCQGGYHTYTFEVDRSQSPEALRWYLDGTLYWQVVQTDMSAAVWEKTAHGPVFILLNMAMGGSFPDGVYGSKTPLANTSSGGVYSIEYVAVYNK